MTLPRKTLVCIAGTPFSHVTSGGIRLKQQKHRLLSTAISLKKSVGCNTRPKYEKYFFFHCAWL